MKPIELLYARRELGMSQDELGEFLGVTRVTLGRWENGLAGTPKSVERLMRVLISAPKEERKAMIDKTDKPLISF